MAGNGGHQHGGNDGEVFGDVVGDAEGGKRAARDEELLADFDDLDELGGVAVEVHHVAGLAGGLGAGVHGHADVGLGQSGGVVGAVTGHGDEVAGLLFRPDALQLGFRRGLGDEVVHARFGGDGGGRLRVVAGDHHGADAHLAQMRKALLDAALDHVLELDHAQDLAAFGHDEGSGAGTRDLIHGLADGLRKLAAQLVHISAHGVGGAFANAADRSGNVGRHGRHGEPCVGCAISANGAGLASAAFPRAVPALCGLEMPRYGGL